MTNIILTPWLRNSATSRLESDYVGGWQSGKSPVLTNITGTWTEGATIYINGSNFSSYNSTGQTFFTDFTQDTIGGRASGLNYWSTVGAEYSVNGTDIPPIGSRCITAHPIQEQIKPSVYQFSSPQNEVYLEAWCRVNKVDFTSSPDAPQIKMFRMTDGTGENSMQGRPLTSDITFESDGSLQAYSNPVVGIGAWFNNGSPQYSPTWNKFVMYLRKGDLDTANGERFIKFGNIESFTHSSVPSGHYASPTGAVAASEYAGEGIITHNSTTAAYQLQRVAMPYFQREQQESIIDISHIYINNSRERVVIGNASTWAACDKTKAYTVPASSRADNRIIIKAYNSTQIPGSLYAYVWNHDGYYNPNGLLVRA